MLTWKYAVYLISLEHNEHFPGDCWVISQSVFVDSYFFCLSPSYFLHDLTKTKRKNRKVVPLKPLINPLCVTPWLLMHTWCHLMCRMEQYNCKRNKKREWKWDEEAAWGRVMWGAKRITLRRLIALLGGGWGESWGRWDGWMFSDMWCLTSATALFPLLSLYVWAGQMELNAHAEFTLSNWKSLIRLFTHIHNQFFSQYFSFLFQYTCGCCYSILC